MEEILKSIKSYLYDRTVSPLIGAFITAWSVWNYRIFIVIFLEKDPTADAIFTNIDILFSTISFNLFSLAIQINGKLFNGFIMPCILTLIYIYLYPIIAKPVYEYSLRRQKELRDAKHKEESNRLLSVEESREIYKRLAEMQVKSSSEVEFYTKQISSLNQTIKELENKLLSETRQENISSTMVFEHGEKRPEEFDNFIRDQIASIDVGDFKLSDLFPVIQWDSFQQSTKQAIGKRFKLMVERGDFVDVKTKGKDPGNKQIYTKYNDKINTIDTLSNEKNKMLLQFVGLKEGNGYSISDIMLRLGGNIEIIRINIQELFEEGYLTKSNFDVVNQEFRYQLTQKGRKYLHENGLLSVEGKS